ncbi:MULTISPECIES: toxin-antitoxin system HicB family antitoxin [unclassified Streptomyces]|uniref:toxin-antitoxin system HicB family antitoxin n=1 Tax=unclassified Streptomyces TaxID=2593676 RepID=UPI00343E07BA
MGTAQLNTRVDQELADKVRASAQRAGMSLNDYVTGVLEADQAAADGPDDLREARARMHARVAYQKWIASGRPETGSMTMGEVFGA